MKKRGRPTLPATTVRRDLIVHAMYELRTEYIGAPIRGSAPERQAFSTTAAYTEAKRRWSQLAAVVTTPGTKSTYLPANVAAKILVLVSAVPKLERLHAGELRPHLAKQISPLIARYPKPSRERILATVATVSRWAPAGLTVSAINKLYRQHHRERGIPG